MQAPISIGTIVQNRYRLTKLLGHGSMVRTYLAEDQGRFNELCALKEIIPAQSAESMFEKSKELFQRETTILYQIQHPQIPQVRATFERDRRWFIVQDYVEGKTLATVLSERRAVGQTFQEAEVLQLMGQLLPPLSYLHSKGVVHRGISPNNIILSDRALMLTNFGIVKDLATRFQSPSPNYHLTPIGIGYAPIEQIQTGIAYPSSDLYALAVTAIVLLTGLEPKELFDETQLLWHWQQWVTLSPDTDKMLHRMLSYKPSDRYQSVAEVEQALQVNSILQLSTPDSPWTQAVAASPAINQSTNNKHQPDPVSVPKREIWDRPWAVVLVYTIVAIVVGVSSGLLVSSLLARQRSTKNVGISPQTFPSPLVSESSTPIPTTSNKSTPNSEKVRTGQWLNLKSGQKTTVRGSLKAKAVAYTFHAEQGQMLNATLTNDNVLLSVLGLDQAPIDDNANRVMRYQGTLPSTGDYTIELTPAERVNTIKYRLSLRLGTLQAIPSDTPTPSTSTKKLPKSP